MAITKLTPLELQIMEVLWTKGECSAREIHERVTARSRQAYTTIQTTIYRLETKNALRCSRRVGNANLFEAVITRDAAEGRLIEDLVKLLGGHGRPIMSHLIRMGKLTQEEIRDAEREFKKFSKKEKRS